MQLHRFCTAVAQVKGTPILGHVRVVGSPKRIELRDYGIGVSQKRTSFIDLIELVSQ